jgi:hypothetical protein
MNRSSSEWRSVLRAYAQRGPQTQSAFCKAQGVSVSTMQWHLKRSRSAATGDLAVRHEAPMEPRLVRVELPSSRSVEVVVAGAVVRVDIGTDVAYVSALVAALRAC